MANYWKQMRKNYIFAEMNEKPFARVARSPVSAKNILTNGLH